MVDVLLFLYQITVSLQQNTTASLLELYFNDSIQTVYARGGGGNRQREVADGTDVAFTDTVTPVLSCLVKKFQRNEKKTSEMLNYNTYSIPESRHFLKHDD